MTVDYIVQNKTLFWQHFMAGTSREKNFKAVKLLPLTNAGSINKDIRFKENNQCFLVLMGAWKQNKNLAKFFQ